MFIKYTGTNVHALGQVNMANLKLNQSPLAVKSLQPGWNEFPKDVWEQNKNHPSIKQMLKDGKLQIMDDQVVVKAKSESGKIAKKKIAVGTYDKKMKLLWFDEKRAVEIIKDTYNRDLLKRWTDEETRSRVKKALDKQIKPLLHSDKEEDENESDDSFEDFE
jgi:hypothetical protein